MLNNDLHLLRDVIRVQAHPPHDAFCRGAALDGPLVAFRTVMGELERDLGALVFFYLRSRRQSAVLGSLRVHQVHSRTPALLTFLVRLPSVEPTGRWRERGRMRRR